MRVHIPKAGNNVFAFYIDDFDIARYADRVRRARRHNPSVPRDDGGGADRFGIRAADQSGARKRKRAAAPSCQRRTQLRQPSHLIARRSSYEVLERRLIALADASK